MKKNLLVSIVMGSQSDWKILSNTAIFSMNLRFLMKKIVSAHRTQIDYMNTQKILK